MGKVDMGGDGVIYDGTNGKCILIACLTSSFLQNGLLFQVLGVLSSWEWLV